jgi:hypothetical protein
LTDDAAGQAASGLRSPTDRHPSDCTSREKRTPIVRGIRPWATSFSSTSNVAVAAFRLYRHTHEICCGSRAR